MIGATVEWYSQGCVKTGEVVAVVPAGVFPVAKDYRHLFRMSRFNPRAPRKKDSYLVAVASRKKATSKRDLYWPKSKLYVLDGVKHKEGGK